MKLYLFCSFSWFDLIVKVRNYLIMEKDDMICIWMLSELVLMLISVWNLFLRILLLFCNVVILMVCFFVCNNFLNSSVVLSFKLVI